MIWLLGGTVNARDLCRLLVTAGYPVVLTVTTRYGEELATCPGATVKVGKLDEADMLQLIAMHGVRVVVDASHPFAAEASENAISAARQAGVPYLRFERPQETYAEARYVDSYDAACAYLATTTGNILLTIGTRNLKPFTALGQERLYARVLPTQESMKACADANLKTAHILAFSGTCSAALNEAVMQEFAIRYLVTKDSGAEGGMREKITAARNAGVETIIIRRPLLAYPQVFHGYEPLLGAIETLKQTIITNK